MVVYTFQVVKQGTLLWYNIVLIMKKQTRILQFKVIIEQDKDGIFVASVPELPGCYTQAKTLEEVRERIKEVINLVLESDKDIKKDKLSSPQSHPKFFAIEDISLTYA